MVTDLPKPHNWEVIIVVLPAVDILAKTVASCPIRMQGKVDQLKL